MDTRAFCATGSAEPACPGASGFNKSCSIKSKLSARVVSGWKIRTENSGAPRNAASNTGCESERVLVMPATFADTVTPLEAAFGFSPPKIAKASAAHTFETYCAA
jgi:hypothetical protein